MACFKLKRPSVTAEDFVDVTWFTILEAKPPASADRADRPGITTPVCWMIAIVPCREPLHRSSTPIPTRRSVTRCPEQASCALEAA
jgi:hypothetical protein